MPPLRVTCFSLFATGILVSQAYAQNDAKPLNLTVPPSIGFPVAGASSATPTSTTPAGAKSTGTTPASANTAPGVYYGDTSGAAANNPNDATVSCDDAAYDKPQVHGSVGMGVVAGNHVAGSYQTGTVNITKPLGDCKHPTGSLSITVGGSQGHFDYPHRGH